MQILSVSTSLNSLRNKKFFDYSKLNAFAVENINVIEKKKFVLRSVENIVGEGENAGYQHFLLFLQCFQKASFSRLVKVRIVWERYNQSSNGFISSFYSFYNIEDGGVWNYSCRRRGGKKNADNHVLPKARQILLSHYPTMLHFDTLKIYSCGRHCDKRRNCL